jgi:ubiquinone/menaquinone biosynthesis C-methylase UbiE
VKISDYDKFDYNYQNYWKTRNYEHTSEMIALEKLLNGTFGGFFLDIGGSYGRLVETYYDRFENPIIVDYSLKTLQKNRELLLKKYPRLTLIAANIYAPPFRDDVFDGALMVRVLHHIERPESYLTQLARIMRNNGTYIQEYANKIHLKARIRALLKGNFRFFSQETFQQPTQMNFEGSNGQETIFLNFHPRYMKDILAKKGFKVLKVIGTSFLRSPGIKRIVPQQIMILLERFAQAILSRLNISPSIFLLTKLEKETVAGSVHKDINSALVCPKCRGELSVDEQRAACVQCRSAFTNKKGIWDFRIDPDEA